MQKGQNDYSFRNQDFCRVLPLKPTPNALGVSGCVIDENWEIIVPARDSRLVRYYADDLCHFFSDAFGVCLRVRRVSDLSPFLVKPDRKILLVCEEDSHALHVASEKSAAFHIFVAEDHVVVLGKTERGTAQGVYYLEDSMRLRGECSLIPEDGDHVPLFSPRMTHSGTELDTFPDSYLGACAHAGMDAIIVYAGHPDSNLHGFADPEALWPGAGRGYCDFNHLVWRAAGYGLDVYVYSHMLCDVHPEDPAAEAYYEASFGTLFRNCPGLKGIIFVGETFEFPSKDPHTCGIRCQRKPADDRRVSPGWYPCMDYPQLLKRVMKIVRRYNPEADIVFWTYNWGDAEKEARLSLIEHLPRDLSLLVTFEMWESFADDQREMYTIDDYTISFPGPSGVFVEEARKANEVGIRLYAMANTGGRTWDNGCAPYLPVPQQWQKRYEALCRAEREYGLCGLMENHHYGWFPSFLSLFSKNAFAENGIPNSEMLRQIARRDYGRCGELALQAWSRFSEGISHVVASAIDQSGPYRCGPTYPLVFDQTREELQIPSVAWAWHKGGEIWDPVYADPVFPDYERILMRYRHVQTVISCFSQGIRLLETASTELRASEGSEVSCQLAVARFLFCTYETAAHVMEWTMAKALLCHTTQSIPPAGANAVCDALGLTDPTLTGLARSMRQIAAKEIENVKAALRCWEEDSRIGFEASMEYAFDDVSAAWKIGETERSLVRLEEWMNGKK